MKRSLAFTISAEVLLESTGAHVDVSKGGNVSEEKNCIILNTKQKKGIKIKA